VVGWGGGAQAISKGRIFIESHLLYRMSDKRFHLLTSALFLLIGTMHVLRALLGWPANVAGYDVPVEVSWVAVAIAAYMVYRSVKLGKFYR
jgi:hypothetical protein